MQKSYGNHQTHLVEILDSRESLVLAMSIPSEMLNRFQYNAQIQ